MESVTSFLLVDEQEQLVVDDVKLFTQHLCCDLGSKLKVVSIFGNTGDGKSHTLNHIFFNGKKVFRTSADQHSCTVGIWVAYAPNHKALVVDTEGLLGVSENENRRTRLLLKTLAISDIVLYRTRAERLHNDMFSFLADASNAYWKHFSPELQAASERNELGFSISSLGPSVIVFHETQFTEILGASSHGLPYVDADFQTSGQDHAITAEEHLQKRFAELKLTPKAFSAIKYIGVQTISPPTDFTGLKKCLMKLLQNNSVRAPRTPDVILKSLQILNEGFTNEITGTRPPLFPDTYFSCQRCCIACGEQSYGLASFLHPGLVEHTLSTLITIAVDGIIHSTRCELSTNHSKNGLPHTATVKCKYQDHLDNKVMLCKKCYDQGEECVVEPKSWSQKDSGWLGIAKYAWSGYVIECPSCGVIYQSRSHWYGNPPPEHGSVKTENRHVWSKDIPSSIDSTASYHRGRKAVDVIGSVTETLSSIASPPTQQMSSLLADQIAPDYWIPNAQITECCVCHNKFGSYLKTIHHCRSCGQGVCTECSTQSMPVPWRGWGERPVRVCDTCYNSTDERKSSVISSSVSGRYFSENVTTAMGWVGGAFKYPKQAIIETTRPSYWIPDCDITHCYVCEIKFSSTCYKHHCRSCGQGVCGKCSLQRKNVPARGWDYPVRVCDKCIINVE